MTDIIIAVHNQFRYTKECILSIVKHTKNFRLIIIDNASTDGTMKYLKSIKGKVNIEIIRNKKNLLCSKAWNQGIEKAENDYVVIANNDIIVYKGWLEGLLKWLDEKIWVVCPRYSHGENSDYEHFKTENTAILAPKLTGFCFAFERKRVKDLKEMANSEFLFDEDLFFYEDKDFELRLVRKGHPAYQSNCSFIHHYEGRTTRMIKNLNEKIERNYDILNSKIGYNQFKQLRNTMKKYKIVSATNLPYYPNDIVAHGQSAIIDKLPDWIGKSMFAVIEIDEPELKPEIKLVPALENATKENIFGCSCGFIAKSKAGLVKHFNAKHKVKK